MLNAIPPSAIHFALNLYQYHHTALSDAYAQAVTQFRALRSEHHVATTFAVMEAEALGSTFGPTEAQSAHEYFKKSISTWERQAELDEGALAARKRWKAIIDKNHGQNQWSKGEEYVRLWQEGARPNYMPALTEPTTEVAKASPPPPPPAAPAPARRPATTASPKTKGPPKTKIMGDYLGVRADQRKK